MRKKPSPFRIIFTIYFSVCIVFHISGSCQWCARVMSLRVGGYMGWYNKNGLMRINKLCPFQNCSNKVICLPWKLLGLEWDRFKKSYKCLYCLLVMSIKKRCFIWAWMTDKNQNQGGMYGKFQRMMKQLQVILILLPVCETFLDWIKCMIYKKSQFICIHSEFCFVRISPRSWNVLATVYNLPWNSED